MERHFVVLSGLQITRLLIRPEASHVKTREGLVISKKF
jgi:hypothetical protein